MIYPRPKKLLDRIFDFGPRFRIRAQNVPKMAQNLKIELLPQLFSYGSHILRLYSPFYDKKNCWAEILILGPVFGLWPQITQNGPILENRTSPSVFELGFSNAQYILTLPCPEMLLDQNFFCHKKVIIT